MDRNELLQLYETHVLPKPQRDVFKCIDKNAKITNISSDVPSSTTNFKRIHSPEKTCGFFQQSKIYPKKNRFDIHSNDLKRHVRENNESIEDYPKSKVLKTEKVDKKNLTNVEETKNGEPSSPPKKKFKRIEFP